MRAALCVVVVCGCSFTPGYLPALTSDGGDGAVDASDVTVDARMPPGPGPCGKPGALADDFVDTVTARVWTVYNPAQITEGNGELAITPMANATGTFSGYISNPSVDMRAAAVEVEVRESVDNMSGAAALFGISFGTDALGFEQRTGQLVGRIGGSVASVPYDPSAHRLWRIEHAAPMITLSTSPSGLVWTPLVSAAAPAWLATSFVTLGANNLAGAAAPGTVRFASFNTYVPSATWCPSTDLSDTFDDAVIGNVWAYHGHSSNGCIEHETTGSARVDQNGSAACDAYYGASTLYSLAGSAIRARITTINTFANGWITYLGVWDLEDRYVRLSFDQDNMCADGTDITRTCVGYVDAQDLWRIREDAGVVYWEVAQGPTPASWRLVHSAPAPFALSAVRPYFGTNTNRAITQSINLSVDRFN